jgi:hypothetical protein
MPKKEEQEISGTCGSMGGNQKKQKENQDGGKKKRNTKKGGEQDVQKENQQDGGKKKRNTKKGGEQDVQKENQQDGGKKKRNTKKGGDEKRDEKQQDGGKKKGNTKKGGEQYVQKENQQDGGKKKRNTERRGGMDGNEDAFERTSRIDKEILKKQEKRQQQKYYTEMYGQIRAANEEKNKLIMFIKKNIDNDIHILGTLGNNVGKIISEYPIYEVYRDTLLKFVNIPNNPFNYLNMIQTIKDRSGYVSREFPGKYIPPNKFNAYAKKLNKNLGAKIGEDQENYLTIKERLIQNHIILKQNISEGMDLLQLQKTAAEANRNDEEDKRNNLWPDFEKYIEDIVTQEAKAILEQNPTIRITMEQAIQQKQIRINENMHQYSQKVEEANAKILQYETERVICQRELEKLYAIKQEYFMERGKDLKEDEPEENVYYEEIPDIKDKLSKEYEFYFENDRDVHGGTGRGCYNFNLGIAMIQELGDFVGIIEILKQNYDNGMRELIDAKMISPDEMEIDKINNPEEHVDELLSMFSSSMNFKGGNKTKKGKSRKQTK